MSRLRFETQNFLSSSLGAESPLPALVNERELHDLDDAPGVPQEILRNIGAGNIPSILPYTVQDGYDRELREKPMRVAVLENEHLRATFLLELGGRMWSLFDKVAGRELLYTNRCIQFANLAIRNAWFAGGVEWNCGVIGHSPHTCSPMYAARVGEDTLRLYEYERIREVMYQLDFSLPDESKFLHVTVTIRNPHDREIPMYWWSNIAVPLVEGSRVVVPAERAFVFGYEGRLKVQVVPEFEGTDATYGTRVEWPQDYFFDVPEERRKWIACLDREGYGLVQASTSRLVGRKLFLWGTGGSGTSWQGMLSPMGGEYQEIQAGLAKTQLEYLTMPARAWWSWTEAYGPLQADPSAVHGSDWHEAIDSVEQRLEEALPEGSLERLHDESMGKVEHPVVATEHLGSGWALLEDERRRMDGEDPLPSRGLTFDLPPEDRAWRKTLEGRKVDFDPSRPSFIVDPAWEGRLAESPFHLGILKWYQSDQLGAENAWLRCGPTDPWALRNLAVSARVGGDYDLALERYERATGLEPSCLPLSVEVAAFLLEHDPRRCIEFVRSCPFHAHSRMRFVEAQAAMELGELETVERFFEDVPLVTDLREGDGSYDQLARRYRELVGREVGVSFRMIPE